jgi:hypothetical protein
MKFTIFLATKYVNFYEYITPAGRCSVIHGQHVGVSRLLPEPEQHDMRQTPVELVRGMDIIGTGSWELH